MCEDMRRILHEIGFISTAIKCDSDHVVKCFDAWCEFQSNDDYLLFVNLSEGNKPMDCPTVPTRYDSVEKKQLLSSPVLNNSSNLFKVAPYKKRKQFKVYFFMLFELCSNTLEDYMFSKLPTKNAIECIKHIADGLAVIHQQNIIHRDIKPSNIFISKEGKPKIGDFGLSVMRKCSHSEAESRLTQSVSDTAKDSDEINSFISSTIARTSRTFSESYECEDDKYDEAGSLPYLAPEQIAHLEIDSSVDIYSLGLVLYLLIVEFSTAHEKSLLIKNLKNGKVEDSLLSKCPEICDLILRMTDVHSERRPSASEVGDKLGLLCKAM
jgi:serine/threonine protein kinase